MHFLLWFCHAITDEASSFHRLGFIVNFPVCNLSPRSGKITRFYSSWISWILWISQIAIYHQWKNKSLTTVNDTTENVQVSWKQVFRKLPNMCWALQTDFNGKLSLGHNDVDENRGNSLLKIDLTYVVQPKTTSQLISYRMENNN